MRLSSPENMLKVIRLCQEWSSFGVSMLLCMTRVIQHHFTYLTMSLSRTSVEAAHELIQPHIHRTPVLTNTTLSDLASAPQIAFALKETPWEGQEPAKPKIRLFFKCENFQKIGAFKVRGAFHAVLRLIEDRGIEEVRKKGVVTHSSGMFLSIKQHYFESYG